MFCSLIEHNLKEGLEMRIISSPPVPDVRFKGKLPSIGKIGNTLVFTQASFFVISAFKSPLKLIYLIVLIGSTGLVKR
jgi:hypothetical protein